MKKMLMAVVVGGAVALLGCLAFEFTRKATDPQYRAHEEQEITCVRNLKQLGLSFRIWSGDNGDKYPFHLGTNQGGTLELRSVAKDGFDGNAWRHFLLLSNELSSPILLVCPDHAAKQAASQWEHFGPDNVTYRLQTGDGVQEDNPTNILAVCPFDGNTLYCDGHVVEGKGK